MSQPSFVCVFLEKQEMHKRNCKSSSQIENVSTIIMSLEVNIGMIAFIL